MQNLAKKFITEKVNGTFSKDIRYKIDAERKARSFLKITQV